LNLPQPETFTGHAFRRSSATHLADAGASSVDLKRQFNWKDEQTANRYIVNSRSRNSHVAELIQQSVRASSSGVSGAPLSNSTSTTTTTAQSTTTIIQQAQQGSSVTSGGDKETAQKNVTINVHPGATLNLHM